MRYLIAQSPLPATDAEVFGRFDRQFVGGLTYPNDCARSLITSAREAMNKMKDPLAKEELADAIKNYEKTVCRCPSSAAG
jgi:hypothetical protein